MCFGILIHSKSRILDHLVVRQELHQQHKLLKFNLGIKSFSHQLLIKLHLQPLKQVVAQQLVHQLINQINQDQLLGNLQERKEQEAQEQVELEVQ